jgi:hypothetical protein
MYNSKDIAARGKAIYEEHLRARFDTDENLGKILSIDVNSGDHEMGEDGDDIEILDRLRSRRPDAEIYTLKIGYPAAVALGTRLVSMRELEREEGA